MDKTVDKYIVQILLSAFMLMFALSADAKPNETNSSYEALKQVLTNYFAPYPNNNISQDQRIMDDLLNVHGQQPLTYPPFPRTWIEMYLGATTTTTTKAGVDTGKIAVAIATLQGTPFSWPVGAAVKLASLGISGSATSSIKYSYDRKTSFIAMSSFRRIDPTAKKNNTTPMVVPESGDLPAKSPLRKVLYKKRNKAYFNVTEEYPMVGMCKYELSLSITTTLEKKISFVLADRLKERINDVGQVYSVYSNFFKIENNVPIQEYLRVKCDEVFLEAVRFFVESDFNTMVEDVFANYHPDAQCELPEEDVLDSKGDSSCKDWFQNPKFVMGSYRKANVPRCVLGTHGIPVCSLRAKAGATCPIYEWNGRLTDRMPITDNSSNSLTAGNYSHFSCDEGLKCKPPTGELNQYLVTWKDKLTGIDARCKKDLGN